MWQRCDRPRAVGEDNERVGLSNDATILVVGVICVLLLLDPTLGSYEDRERAEDPDCNRTLAAHRYTAERTDRETGMRAKYTGQCALALDPHQLLIPASFKKETEKMPEDQAVNPPRWP